MAFHNRIWNQFEELFSNEEEAIKFILQGCRRRNSTNASIQMKRFHYGPKEAMYYKCIGHDNCQFQVMLNKASLKVFWFGVHRNEVGPIDRDVAASVVTNSNHSGQNISMTYCSNKKKLPFRYQNGSMILNFYNNNSKPKEIEQILKSDGVEISRTQISAYIKRNKARVEKRQQSELDEAQVLQLKKQRQNERQAKHRQKLKATMDADVAKRSIQWFSDTSDEAMRLWLEENLSYDHSVTRFDSSRIKVFFLQFI